MLWMGRWIHHNTISTMIVHLKLIEMAEFMGHTWATYDVILHWLMPQTHMKLFQLHSKHVQCVWEHSYAGDGEMDPPSCLFHHDHSSQFNWDGDSQVTPGLHMMSYCSDWGSRSTSNDSHIHSKHIHGVWEHSYSVDEEMDPPSCLFHHDCSSQINWDSRIHGSHLGYIWCRTALVEAPDPHEVVPTPLQTCSMCLRAFICCGWGDGSTIMPLPPWLFISN